MRTFVKPAVLRLASAGLVALMLVVVKTTAPVEALCATPAEAGNWINVDSNTQSLTRVNLRFVCQDQILNGQPYPPGPPWYTRVFGRCTPSDCDWQEVGSQQLTSGYVYSVYTQGFATRYVWAKMSAYRPGQLWVYTYTDFADPNRPDYEMNNWFRR
jgi:hypothetical protein